MPSNGGVAIGSGAAAPAEESEDANALEERRRAATYLWSAGGALSLIVLALPGFSERSGPPALGPAGGCGAGLGGGGARGGPGFSERAFFAFTVAAILMITVATYFSGPVLSPSRTAAPH